MCIHTCLLFVNFGVVGGVLLFVTSHASTLQFDDKMSCKESSVFTKHYSIFCDTLTDIDNLLKYFVQEKVIKPEDQDEINALVKKTEKVQKLLKHIAGPLEAGDNKGFYTMLDIMENHGVQATKDLADSLKTILSKGSHNDFLHNFVTTVYLYNVTIAYIAVN